jgi:serine/threonine-protein kinase
MVIKALHSRATGGRHYELLSDLGQCLEYGNVAPKDLVLAAECYCSAAEKVPHAQMNYGFCLEHGLGTEQDLLKSVSFYEKAMRAGHLIGTGHYGLSLHYGRGFDEDVEAAADYYDIVLKKNRLFLTDNSSRCFRGLNRRRPPKAAKPRRQPSDDFRIPCWMLEHRVEPICLDEGQTLGKGSNGRVIGHAGKTAVKQLFSQSPGQDFVREVAMLVSLKHPCIVKCKGWSIADSNGRYEIQMEWAENGALSKYCGNQATESVRDWNSNRKAKVICDIVLGMRYVHSRGIIHRDLKPGNIILDANWGALIADVGEAERGGGAGQGTLERGTMIYVPPEQWFGKCQYTDRVDVFAFGLVLYEIIAGFPWRRGDVRNPLPPVLDRREFGGADPGEVMLSLIPRCWAKDEHKRPSFAAIFDEFKACDFSILPKVDSKEIRTHVLKVLEADPSASSEAFDLRTATETPVDLQDPSSK